MKYSMLGSNKFFLILVIGLLLNNFKCNFKERESLEKKSEKKGINSLPYTKTPIIIDKSLNSFYTPALMDSPLIFKKSILPLNSCECASLVRCTPCGSISKIEVIDCPCAPKPKCPVCPPLSLIHEMAAKKAREDQRTTNRLRGITLEMNRFLDSITKFSDDVVKYELEAKEEAQKMETASMKAEMARRNMLKMSEQAKMIAKQTFSPCYGTICKVGPQDSIMNIPFDDNKIFPEEVDNISEYTQQVKEDLNSSNFIKN